MNDNKQCETCSWPLDCCEEQQAAKPVGADCPRDAEVWNRRLGDAGMVPAPATALLKPAETDEELVGELV